jgi:hypothetical protein
LCTAPIGIAELTGRRSGPPRTQVVHDLDHCEPDVVDELMAARTYLCFGPDTLPEARNRGYRTCRCPGSRAARQAETDIDADG